MHKVYFDGSEGKNEIVLDSPESLRKFCLHLDVHTDVEHRVNDLYIVKSMNSVGGSQYLANGIQDSQMLTELAEKVERRGDSVWYYVRLKGQKVAV